MQKKISLTSIHVILFLDDFNFGIQYVVSKLDIAF